MAKWETDPDGTTRAEDEATGRTYSISEADDGNFVLKGISMGGRARATMGRFPAKSVATLRAMDIVRKPG